MHTKTLSCTPYLHKAITNDKQEMVWSIKMNIFGDLAVFNGQYKKAGYGFGFGLTVGGALIQLGEARTDLSSLSPSLGAGWDNSIIGTVGWSKVVTSRIETCSCS